MLLAVAGRSVCFTRRYGRHPSTLFSILKRNLAGETMKVAVVSCPSAALTSRQERELTALPTVQVFLVREDPWPPPCDVDFEASS